MALNECIGNETYLLLGCDEQLDEVTLGVRLEHARSTREEAFLEVVLLRRHVSSVGRDMRSLIDTDVRRGLRRLSCSVGFSELFRFCNIVQRFPHRLIFWRAVDCLLRVLALAGGAALGRERVRIDSHL